MNTKNIIFTIFLILLLGVLGLIGYRCYQTQKAPMPTEEVPEERAQPTVEKLNLTKSVSGWIVWWDQENSFESFKDNAGVFTSVKPFWYQLTLDGKIKKLENAEDSEIIEFAQTNKIKIIPTITNDHKPDPATNMLNDVTKRNAHIQDKVKMIDSTNYEDNNNDYESLNSKDRQAYSNFITELAKQVHAKNKLITTALHAKTSEPGEWEGPQAQDWSALGQAVDAVKIMCYDYHWETSEAGAIAPLGWTEDVIKFALTKIPKEKIELGVPFYGYDWVEERGAGVTFKDAQMLIKNYSATVVRDLESGEVHFQYSTGADEKHTVWYNDSESLAGRLDLVLKYDLAGIGIWRLGQEDTKNFTVIQRKFTKK